MQVSNLKWRVGCYRLLSGQLKAASKPRERLMMQLIASHFIIYQSADKSVVLTQIV